MTPTLIVEDDPAMQRRLCTLLVGHGLAPETVRVTDSIAGAHAACAAEQFRLALIDIGLPDGSGLRLIEWMRATSPQITPIVISAFGTEELIVAALRCGAHGYLLKERDDEELRASLRTIAHGGAPIDPFVARHILRVMSVDAPGRPAPESSRAGAMASPDGDPEYELTPRELEILNWVARGLISKEIAHRLARSPQTVECHIKNIFRKMSVTTRTEAVSKARQHGLLH